MSNNNYQLLIPIVEIESTPTFDILPTWIGSGPLKSNSLTAEGGGGGGTAPHTPRVPFILVTQPALS